MKIGVQRLDGSTTTIRLFSKAGAIGIYGRRNDSESLNRGLEDTLFLGAHSLGWRRQQVEMIGWACMVNALTMASHRSADGLQQAA